MWVNSVAVEPIRAQSADESTGSDVWSAAVVQLTSGPVRCSSSVRRRWRPIRSFVASAEFAGTSWAGAAPAVESAASPTVYDRGPPVFLAVSSSKATYSVTWVRNIQTFSPLTWLLITFVAFHTKYLRMNQLVTQQLLDVLLECETLRCHEQRVSSDRCCCRCQRISWIGFRRNWLIAFLTVKGRKQRGRFPVDHRRAATFAAIATVAAAAATCTTTSAGAENRQVFQFANGRTAVQLRYGRKRSFWNSLNG